MGAVEKFDAAEVDAGLALGLVLVLVRRERVALVPAEKHGIGAGEADVAHVDVLRSLLLGFRQAGIVDLDLAGCLDPALGVVEADGVLELKRADGSKLERAPVDERAALYQIAALESSTVRSFVSAPFSETMILLTASVPVSLTVAVLA